MGVERRKPRYWRTEVFQDAECLSDLAPAFSLHLLITCKPVDATGTDACCPIRTLADVRGHQVPSRSRRHRSAGTATCGRHKHAQRPRVAAVPREPPPRRSSEALHPGYTE